MPYGTRKKRDKIGRDKAPLKTDCVACMSTRSVKLTVTKKAHEVKATGRCFECGFTSFITSLAQDEFTVMNDGAVLRRVREDDPDHPGL